MALKHGAGQSNSFTDIPFRSGIFNVNFRFCTFQHLVGDSLLNYGDDLCLRDVRSSRLGD